MSIKYPAVHGGGGHSFVHNPTTVNEPDRICGELSDRHWRSYGGSNHSVSVFWHPRTFALYLLDSLRIYGDFYYSLLSSKTTV
jgi:hypothetical protein